MTTAIRSLPQFSIPMILWRSAVISATSVASVLLGVVPALQVPAANAMFSQAAYAQTVSDQEVQNYARAVLAIEPIRQSAYNRIKQLVGSSNVPEIYCDQPSSISNLPENVRGIAVEYCNQAIPIAERYQLSITRFNEITRAHQNDPALSNRIQQAILQLQ
jgi:hypothetical protein